MRINRSLEDDLNGHDFTWDTHMPNTYFNYISYTLIQSYKHDVKKSSKANFIISNIKNCKRKSIKICIFSNLFLFVAERIILGFRSFEPRMSGGGWSAVGKEKYNAKPYIKKMRGHYTKEVCTNLNFEVSIYKCLKNIIILLFYRIILCFTHI